MLYYVYILRTDKDTLYIGQTNNLNVRLKQHNSHTTKSAKYTRYFQTLDLVYQEQYPTRQEAMKRERQLKKWSKAKKEALFKDNFKSLK